MVRKVLKKKTETHEDKINNFIKDAIRVANEKIDGIEIKFETRYHSDGTAYNHCMWTEFYHKEMNRLTKKAGLRI